MLGAKLTAAGSEVPKTQQLSPNRTGTDVNPVPARPEPSYLPVTDRTRGPAANRDQTAPSCGFTSPRAVAEWTSRHEGAEPGSAPARARERHTMERVNMKVRTTNFIRTRADVTDSC